MTDTQYWNLLLLISFVASTNTAQSNADKVVCFLMAIGFFVCEILGVPAK